MFVRNCVDNFSGFLDYVDCVFGLLQVLDCHTNDLRMIFFLEHFQAADSFKQGVKTSLVKLYWENIILSSLFKPQRNTFPTSKPPFIQQNKNPTSLRKRKVINHKETSHCHIYRRKTQETYEKTYSRVDPLNSALNPKEKSYKNGSHQTRLNA